MGKFVFFSVIILVIVLASLSNSLAQWEPDVNLTNDPFTNRTSDNNAWCVAASGDTVHVVWEDNSDGNAFEIYYQRSINGGSDWEPDTMLSGLSNTSRTPSITTEGSYVYIVYEDSRDGNPEIYFRGSLDGGTTWGFEKRLSNSSTESRTPSIAATGSDVHVVFREGAFTQSEIFYRKSTNNGNFWVINTQLTNNASASESPSVAVYDQTVHVAWWDQRDGNPEIYYKRSSDGGVNWSSDTRLTIDVNNSVIPSIGVNGSNVHLLWQDARSGSYDIYYKRSTDAGLSWDSDIQLTTASALSQAPSVAVSDSVIHILWLDDRNGNRDLFHKRSIDNGINWSTDERLTNNTSGQALQHHSVAVSGSAVHIVWQDYRDGSMGEIYYKRNLTGNPTDVTIADNNLPDDFLLYQNFPNPFNPTTTIQFSIPIEEYVTLNVFNTFGENVSTVVSQNLGAGTYKVQWDASMFASGVYFYRLMAGQFTQTKKFVLLR